MVKLKVLGEFDFGNYEFSQNVDYEIFRLPLFHGTRRYALEVSEDKRKEFYDACNVMIPFAKKLIDEKKIDFNYVVNAVDKSSAYQYGDFYLTTSFSGAIDYSYYVGGELGQNVYKVSQEIINKGLELTNEIKAAIALISKEYIKYSESAKVVLIFLDVNFSDLYSRGGRKIIDQAGIDEDTKVKIRCLYEKVDDENRTFHNDFRIKNPNEYGVYIVKEENFREGLKLFTKIDDVDKFIKLHNSVTTLKWDF